MYTKEDYEVISNDVGKCVKRSDGACIPFDPQNRDYQEYLKIIEK